MTWGRPRIAASAKNKDLCEPFAIRSPDGRQIALLMREDFHFANSMVAFSSDEGDTWTEPVDTCWGLTGDRHVLRYLSDGRIICVFRDMAPLSPTKGHFVAWVGTYQDMTSACSGQYRVKLLHNYAGWDCGYPGLEILPDGTVVSTTYIKYHPGTAKHSVVSVRFKIEELDALF